MTEKILYYFFFTSVLIWFIPPIRQYRTDYFYFFLILAVTDVFSLLFNYIINIDQFLAFNLFSYFAVITLQKKEFIVRYLSMLILTALVIISITIALPSSNNFTFIIIHTVLLYIFLRRFIHNFYFMNMVNIFLLGLIFYEFTVITKFMNLITGFTNAYYYYVITSVFQIIFGLFFSVFREGDTRLIFKLK